MAGQGFALECNFNLAPNLNHSIWMESRAQLAAATENLRPVHHDDERSGLQGELQQNELNSPLNHLQITRVGPVVEHVWTPAMNGGHIVQHFVSRTNNNPDRIVIVLDGSVDMKAHLTEIAEAVDALENHPELRVLLASDIGDDGWLELPSDDQNDAIPLQDAITQLRPAGGQDNVPALRHAWELASEGRNGRVIWIHGPQPVLLESAEGLRQRLERNRSRTRLLDFQTRTGPNRLAEALDGLGVQSVMRAGTMEADLKDLFDTMFASNPRPGFERTHLEAAAPADGIKEVSKHIARLWAAEEVYHLMKTRAFTDAVRLAGDYQLVTPVSGAVVLETQAQYDLAGLSPVDATTVPMVPEPSTWLLLTLGLLIFWWRRQRRIKTRATA